MVSYLLLPKIELFNNYILIGEILSLIYLFIYLLKFLINKKININMLLLIYILLLFYSVLLSSFVSYLLFFRNPPYYSVFYFAHLLLCFSVYISTSYINGVKMNKIIINTYIIHSIIMIIFMVLYYIIKKPNEISILWGYDFGLRMQMLNGSYIDISNIPFFLQYEGGGSGNLFVSWSLFVFIYYIEDCKNKNKKINYFFIFYIIFLVILTFSRGGILTFFILLLWYLLIENKKKLSDVIKILIFILLLSIIFTKIINVNVFTRLINTINDGKFDASSSLRLQNYKLIFQALIGNLNYFILGYGFEKQYWYEIVNWNFAESSVLQLLGSSGIIGLTLFLLLIMFLYYNKNKNSYYNILFKYIVFQLIINWSVTGGDFFGVVNTYIIFLLIGMASNSKYSYKKYITLKK